MEARKILITTTLLTSLLFSASPFETKSQVSRTIALFAARECKNTTPTGSVKPQKGVFKGKTINYQDDRGKHTCFHDKTQSQLEALIKNPDQKKNEQDFSVAFKNKDGSSFGSQLNKEMVSNYAGALTEALENGVYDAQKKKVFHTFEYKVGADNSSGKFTQKIRVDSLSVNEDVSYGVHMFPFE
jgi:hypothetical protein